MSSSADGQSKIAVFRKAPIKGTGVTSVKRSMRDLRRLLNNPHKKFELPPEVRAAKEAQLRALEAEVASKEAANRALARDDRYEGVKFIEKKKVARRIDQVKRELAAMLVDPDLPPSVEEATLRNTLADLTERLLYIEHHPSGLRYASIIKDPDTKKVAVMRAQVLRQVLEAQGYARPTGRMAAAEWKGRAPPSAAAACPLLSAEEAAALPKPPPLRAPGAAVAAAITSGEVSASSVLGKRKRTEVREQQQQPQQGTNAESKVAAPATAPQAHGKPAKGKAAAAAAAADSSDSDSSASESSDEEADAAAAAGGKRQCTQAAAPASDSDDSDDSDDEEEEEEEEEESEDEKEENEEEEEEEADLDVDTAAPAPKPGKELLPFMTTKEERKAGRALKKAGGFKDAFLVAAEDEAGVEDDGDDVDDVGAGGDEGDEGGRTSNGERRFGRGGQRGGGNGERRFGRGGQRGGGNGERRFGRGGQSGGGNGERGFGRGGQRGSGRGRGTGGRGRGGEGWRGGGFRGGAFKPRGGRGGAESGA